MSISGKWIVLLLLVFLALESREMWTKAVNKGWNGEVKIVQAAQLTLFMLNLCKYFYCDLKQSLVGFRKFRVRILADEMYRPTSLDFIAKIFSIIAACIIRLYKGRLKSLTKRNNDTFIEL